MTLGDAIASFLDTPDMFTVGNCIANKDTFSMKKAPALSLMRDLQGLFGIWNERTQRTHGVWSPLPVVWLGRRRLWFSAASQKRWAFCIGL